MGKQLGYGTFGKVHLATHHITQQERAIKTIVKNTVSKVKAEREKFLKEVDTLKTISHPNIIKIYEFYEDHKNFHLVTEVCSGGELFDYIIESKTLDENMAARVM
jgi:calcium-dependent protein kinase